MDRYETVFEKGKHKLWIQACGSSNLKIQEGKERENKASRETKCRA